MVSGQRSGEAEADVSRMLQTPRCSSSLRDGLFLPPAVNFTTVTDVLAMAACYAAYSPPSGLRHVFPPLQGGLRAGGSLPKGATWPKGRTFPGGQPHRYWWWGAGPVMKARPSCFKGWQLWSHPHCPQLQSILWDQLRPGFCLHCGTTVPSTWVISFTPNSCWSHRHPWHASCTQTLISGSYKLVLRTRIWHLTYFYCLLTTFL